LTGGLLTLTHGTAKPTLRGKNVYPIEALVTVLPAVPDGDDETATLSSSSSSWTLLSLSVNVQAKTGEFNHQLEASNRQRFDLHRLAALAMSREERACEKQQQQEQQERKKAEGEEASNDDNNNATATTVVSKPLERLFRVANTFLLSWQLEVLSAQAQSLRRGVWAAAEGTPIAVTPVKFADDKNGNGRMIISFWKVDDSYGPPTMKCLYGYTTTTSNDNDDNDDDQGGDNYSPMHDLETSSQLRLAICTNTTATTSTAGISLYLSGADARLVDSNSTIVQDLIRAASDPLSLSASDALLAATKLCAELKCRAVVAALTLHDHLLPPWIKLIVGKGVIDVAAAVQYHGITPDKIRLAKLFQIRCDLRTGSFVNTFPRSMMLLRRLAGNEARASEPMAVRLNAMPESRRRAASAQSTGRAVRDVFDALIRSLNQLGHRTGLGSEWDNVSAESASLRARAIHLSCIDVKACLVRCCGATALYGTLPAAIGAAVGMAAVPDL
jgi:hypothetical protein